MFSVKKNQNCLLFLYKTANIATFMDFLLDYTLGQFDQSDIIKIRNVEQYDELMYIVQ